MGALQDILLYGLRLIFDNEDTQTIAELRGTPDHIVNPGKDELLGLCRADGQGSIWQFSYAPDRKTGTSVLDVVYMHYAVRLSSTKPTDHIRNTPVAISNCPTQILQHFQDTLTFSTQYLHFSSMAESTVKHQVMIAAGGITGLTLALAFEGLNVDYVLLETYGSVTPNVGASIGLFAHGLRILDQLGGIDHFKPYMVPGSVTQLRDGKAGTRV
ncbi:uncharacterized protein PG998_014240 [Apiospora kogelbergensis]|uniref:uncharacterized protein n=1 Tax=Apiospora kogelbergensis TaxID=1337665 RepID=UPI00312CEF4C